MLLSERVDPLRVFPWAYQSHISSWRDDICCFSRSFATTNVCLTNILKLSKSNYTYKETRMYVYLNIYLNYRFYVHYVQFEAVFHLESLPKLINPSYTIIRFMLTEYLSCATTSNLILQKKHTHTYTYISLNCNYKY